MRNSKIIDLLSSFTVVEMKQFKNFISSPYFNKQPDLLALFELLFNQHPKFDSEALKKEAIFQRLFPNEVFEDKTMRYLMSDLSKLAERFLVIQNYEKDKEQVKLDLLSCYLERKQEKHYKILKPKIKARLEAVDLAESQIHFKRMQLADIEEHYFEQQRQRRFDPNIQIASNELDRYYFIKKLKYSSGMQDRQQFLLSSYQDNLGEGLLQFIVDNNYFDNDLIKAYYSILFSLRDDSDENHFFQLKDLLSLEEQKISKNDLKEVYLAAINFCARKIRKGEVAYLSEALELYRRGIEKQVLIENGILSPWTFTNVVKLALRLQQYDWIEAFIKKNSQKLPESFRKNALNYNLAELYYYRKDYSQAQDYLNLVKYSDLNYYLGSRVMLIKIYYENNEEQLLLSQLASFTMFLKRNKEISTHLKKTYLNFCNLLFVILKQNPKQLLQLDEKIANTSPLTDKEWLLKQLEAVAR